MKAQNDIHRTVIGGNDLYLLVILRVHEIEDRKTFVKLRFMPGTEIVATAMEVRIRIVGIYAHSDDIIECLVVSLLILLKEERVTVTHEPVSYRTSRCSVDKEIEVRTLVHVSVEKLQS